MTEKEALRILGDTTLCTPLGQASFVAIEAIKKLQQYYSIGTVEECREATGKQQAKKVKTRKLLRDFNKTIYSVQGDCPSCGREGLLSMNTNYCNACGQKLDWSE